MSPRLLLLTKKNFFLNKIKIFPIMNKVKPSKTKKRKERSEESKITKEELKKDQPKKKKVKTNEFGKDFKSGKEVENERAAKQPPTTTTTTTTTPETTTTPKPPKVWTSLELASLIEEKKAPKIEFSQVGKTIEIKVAGEMFYLKLGDPVNPLLSKFTWSDKFPQKNDIYKWQVSVNKQFNPDVVTVLTWLDEELTKWGFSTLKTKEPVLKVESETKEKIDYFKVGHIRKLIAEKSYTNTDTKTEMLSWEFRVRVFTSEEPVGLFGNYLNSKTKVFEYKEGCKGISDCVEKDIIDYKDLFNRNKSIQSLDPSRPKYFGTFHFLQTRITHVSTYANKMGIVITCPTIVVIPSELRQKMQQIQNDANKVLVEDPPMIF